MDGVTVRYDSMNRKNFMLEKNLSVLRGIDPGLAELILLQDRGHDLAMMETKTGMPTLKAGGHMLHSSYDPVKETREWVRHYEKETRTASSIFVLGCGLGYHILELSKVPDKEITVFEPRLDILKTAFETFCFSSLLRKIRFVTDEQLPSVGKHTAILQHKPSEHANPEYFQKIYQKLKARKRLQSGLKILVVGPIYGGSLSIARSCSSTLKKMGHNVELLDNSRFADALFYAKDLTTDKAAYNHVIDKLSAFLSETVMARCGFFKPDLVLALAQAPLTEECLRRLRETGVKTAYWFVEDFRMMNYWKNIAGLYDYFFTIQRGDFFNELQKAGVKHFHYLPLAADPDVHKRVELKDEERAGYGSDISFVGAGYHNRRHMFKGLLDLDFKIWGTDWDMASPVAGCVQRIGGRIDTEEMVMIFNAASIHINLHSSTYHKGINPFGDFINPRTFEIAACGAFQLVDPRAELSDVFKAGEEIIVFEDLEDLRQKIAYYLEHGEERAKIAQKAQQKVLRAHTYRHRMNEMLEFIADSGFNPRLTYNSGENIEGLIEEAGRDSELAQYLSRFLPLENITLPEIVKEIGKSEGQLSRTEKMFLAMNEFLR